MKKSKMGSGFTTAFSSWSTHGWSHPMAIRCSNSSSKWSTMRSSPPAKKRRQKSALWSHYSVLKRQIIYDGRQHTASLRDMQFAEARQHWMTTGIIDDHCLRLVDIAFTICELLRNDHGSCVMWKDVARLFMGIIIYFLSRTGLWEKASQKLTPHRSAEEKEHLKRFPGISYYSFSHMHFSDIASDTTYFSTTKRIPILVL